MALQMFAQFFSFGRTNDPVNDEIHPDSSNDILDSTQSTKSCRSTFEMDVENILNCDYNSLSDPKIFQEKCCPNCKPLITKLKTMLAKEISDKNQKILLMTEYGKNTHEWIIQKNAEIESLTRERNDLRSQCNINQEILTTSKRQSDNLEAAFSEIQAKYIREKQTTQILLGNIEILKHSLAEHQRCLDQKQMQFLQLKEHATERLNHANVQLALMEDKFAMENADLRKALNEVHSKYQSLLKDFEIDPDM